LKENLETMWKESMVVYCKAPHCQSIFTVGLEENHKKRLRGRQPVSEIRFEPESPEYDVDMDTTPQFSFDTQSKGEMLFTP
jgi:hypothetical protein